MSEDDVNKEATNALKDMLGLGVGGSAPAPRKVPESSVVTPVDDSKKEQQAPPKSKKKKKPKKKKNPQQQKSPPKDDNFAFSAFQSPPDASALPLPSFATSPVEPRPQVSPGAASDELKAMLGIAPSNEKKQQQQGQGVDLSQYSSPPPPL